MDEFTGVNLHWWSPRSVDAVHSIREYHFWEINQNKDPDDLYKFSPAYKGDDFDAYYAELTGNHGLVVPCFENALDAYGEADDTGEVPGDCLKNPPIDSGDGTDPEDYINHAEYMYQFAARYGNTPVDLETIQERLATDQEAATGLGYINYMENWNEPDFDNTCTDGNDGRRFTPLQYNYIMEQMI